MNNTDEWTPFGDNILIKPVSKNKIIGETALYCLYGTVLAVGSDVKNIKPGNFIAYTLWGLRDVEEGEEKSFFVRENSSFILGVKKSTL